VTFIFSDNLLASKCFLENGLAEAGGALLDVIAIRKAVIPQDVAVVPELLNELGGGGHIQEIELAEVVKDRSVSSDRRRLLAALSSTIFFRDSL